MAERFGEHDVGGALILAAKYLIQLSKTKQKDNVNIFIGEGNIGISIICQPDSRLSCCRIFFIILFLYYEFYSYIAMTIPVKVSLHERLIVKVDP